MKRHTLFAALVAMVLVTSITLGAGKGAVKSPLEVSPLPWTPNQGDGWVIANINANDVLIVTMHIEDGLPGADQDILVQTPFGGTPIILQFVTLNAAGNATGQIKVPLTIPDGVDAVPVQVDTYGASGYLVTDPIVVPVPTK